MAQNDNGTIHQIDAMLADAERRLRDELKRIQSARAALGVRRGRRPKGASA